MSTTTFPEVTEKSGDPATPGQIVDMAYRYRWARDYCRGKRVFEVACGTGQGLCIIASVAREVSGGDIAPALLQIARQSLGSRFSLHELEAADLPISEHSLDVLILFEALYYLPSVDDFLREARRVLAPDGYLLLSTTNKDVFDFVPSPLSRHYYGVPELSELLSRHRFTYEFFGYSRTSDLPLRHRVLRPLKRVARTLRLVPRTMRGKARVRRLLFGSLPAMPHDLSTVNLSYSPPRSLPAGRPDREHRYVFCAARLAG